MMTKEALIKLAQISHRESKFIDFKAELDINSAFAWAEIAKDLIAMSNSGGGIIIFGVNDDGEYTDFDKNIVLTLDPAVISEKISRFIDGDFTEFEQIEITRSGRRLAGIYVSAATIPHVFSINGPQISDGKKFKVVFAAGTIYFRRGAKSGPGNSEYLKKSFNRALEEVRKEWFKGMRQVSEVSVGEAINVEVKKSKKNQSTLSGLIKLSENGVPVKFSDDNVRELKKNFPYSYAEIIKLCKKKRKVPQKELQKYIEQSKRNSELSINWGLIGRNLQIPMTIVDKYTYSEKVVENF